MTGNNIYVSREDLEELKRLYKESKYEIFIFKGRQVLKQYAKYMIEDLERRFGNLNG